MCQYYSQDGPMAAAFFVSLIWRHFACFDKKKTSITTVINVILFSMKLTKIYTVFRKKTPTHIFFHISVNNVWI